MTTNDSLDQAQVLEDAADLLLMSERTRRTPNTQGGEHCVVTALCEASGEGSSLGRRCLYALESALMAKGVWKNPDNSYTLAAQWNDRTEDDFEVIDTLRHVAKDLRNNA